jgi:hypothetical protein
MAQESYPLFSHEEVEFLAPLIVGALAQAQPDQRVRFTMQDDGLTTQGTLYVYKTTLRVNPVSLPIDIRGWTDQTRDAQALLHAPTSPRASRCPSTLDDRRAGTAAYRGLP